MLNLNWINEFNNNPKAPYANCWALTMLICGGMEQPKWADPDEMENWLGEKTHGFEGSPRRGDILIMRSPYGHGRNNCIEHSAIYLGQGRYWHKPGLAIGEYTTLEAMRKEYKYANIVYHVRLNAAQEIDNVRKINRQIASLLKDAA